MRTEQLSEVRGLGLLRGVAEPAVEDLLRGAYVQTFPPQVELVHEGDRPDFLHVVVDGCVELFSAWNGRETTMALLRPVATFILAATVMDRPYLMSARTLEKSRVALIPSEDVRRVYSTDPAFARAVVTELALCYRNVVKHNKNLKLRTSQERLANFLLRQHRRAGQPESFELQLEKRRLASYLGMTPENLSRSIKALGAHGVTVDGSRVTLRDPAALERIARPVPSIDDPQF